MDEKTLTLGLDALWVMLSAVLVIGMQAGFALLEAGSTRMKNLRACGWQTNFKLCHRLIGVLGVRLCYYVWGWE